MSDYERETRITRDPDYVEERTTIVDNTPTDRVVVERRGSALPWILAFVVAVLAILMIFLLMNRQDTTTNADDLAAAMDAGRAAGYAEGASTAVSQMPPVTSTTIPVPVPVPSPSVDTSGVERSAAEAAAAAREAREAAERAADSVANSSTTTTTNTTP